MTWVAALGLIAVAATLPGAIRWAREEWNRPPDPMPPPFRPDWLQRFEERSRRGG